ncbi:MAG: TIGR00374 family protein, partial [Cellulomonadaceae bacterium]|nr:TIGR00374 family protein [Cellulomonadaceae bacterium]
MSSPYRPGSVGLARRVSPEHGVRIVDTPATRVHHPADLLGAVLAATGVALVVVLAVYASGTTSGLTEDVQGIASVVRRILFVPVTVLEGLITFIAPVVVLAELVWRRLVRHALEAVAAAVLGILAALLATWLITEFGIPELREAFSVTSGAQRVVTIPALVTGTAALLTMAGPRSRRRTVGASWNLLWLVLGIALVTGLITLPGALITVLLGRLVGLGLRYLSGVSSERAYGATLVDGIRRAGFDPVRLTRVQDVTAQHPGGDGELAVDLGAVAITRQGDHRVYALTTQSGERLDVVVLDGDRQVLGVLART